MQNEYELLERNRKFAAVFRVARAVHNFENRIGPYIDPIKTEIDWLKIEQELKSTDEEVALHWMRALWKGEMPVGSHALSTLWRTDCKIKEAIVCALAESTFANYVLDERYRSPKMA